MLINNIKCMGNVNTKYKSKINNITLLNFAGLIFLNLLVFLCKVNNCNN